MKDEEEVIMRLTDLSAKQLFHKSVHTHSTQLTENGSIKREKETHE